MKLQREKAAGKGQRAALDAVKSPANRGKSKGQPVKRATNSEFHRITHGTQEKEGATAGTQYSP